MRFWAEAASVRTITILVVEKTRSKQANSTVLLRIFSFLQYPSNGLKDILAARAQARIKPNATGHPEIAAIVEGLEA